MFTELVANYYVADYENPISPEILRAVNARVVAGDKNDHLLLPPEVEEAGPYETPLPREVTGIEVSRFLWTAFTSMHTDVVDSFRLTSQLGSPLLTFVNLSNSSLPSRFTSIRSLALVSSLCTVHVSLSPDFPPLQVRSFYPRSLSFVFTNSFLFLFAYLFAVYSPSLVFHGVCVGMQSSVVTRNPIHSQFRFIDARFAQELELVRFSLFIFAPAPTKLRLDSTPCSARRHDYSS